MPYESKTRKMLADEFIKALSEDKIPWQRNWNLIGQCNATNGKVYRGINAVLLSYIADERGYTDPRWCTFLQAKEKGWSIKKGSKGLPVEFFSLYDKQEKKTISIRDASELAKKLSLQEYKQRISVLTQKYTVFNAAQIDGIPERVLPADKVSKTDLLNYRDVLIKNMQVGFSEGGNQAFYTPGKDAITMPLTTQFRDNYSYMSTFLHEAAHATGHKSRLDRGLDKSWGKEAYAREELRAELSSAFLSAELGIDNSVPRENLPNHKAYIQSWIKELQNNPNELYAAIKDAESITDYLFDKIGIERASSKSIEADISNGKAAALNTEQNAAAKQTKQAKYVPVTQRPIAKMTLRR